MKGERKERRKRLNVGCTRKEKEAIMQHIRSEQKLERESKYAKKIGKQSGNMIMTLIE